MNWTRIILLIAPLGCAVGLWLSGAMMSDHDVFLKPQARDLRTIGLIALLHFAILIALIMRTKRDRKKDRAIAFFAVLPSWLPFVGPVFSGLFSLWFAWDLRKAV